MISRIFQEYFIIIITKKFILMENFFKNKFKKFILNYNYKILLKPFNFYLKFFFLYLL